MREIAGERKLSERTILSHLRKIKLNDPNFNFGQLRSQSKDLKLVLDAVKKIKKKNNLDDFCESGEIKLRPIFERLGEKISYDEIALALLFADY